MFCLEYPIGRGGFGKVWKVKCKLNNKYYAMKIMSKLKIIKKNSVKNINNEKKFLSILHNPFLVNMICSFQDNDNLYLVMDLLLGGDMRFHINRKAIYNRKKDENQLKFVAGCVLMGLKYIHENNIIHKDIKPENLVYDSKGYIHITDFGISKIYHADNGRQARIKEDNIPDGFIKSNTFLDCANFINGLLERRKERRLGYNGFEEIKNHPWFNNFNWDDLFNKKLQPVFIPPLSDTNYDKKYCNEPEKIGDETEEEYESIKNKVDYNKYFINYSSNNKQFFDKIKLSNEKPKNKASKINQAFTKKNVFNIKKDVNTIFKDQKLLKTFIKNNSQSMLANSIKNILGKSHNEKSSIEAMPLKIGKNANKNSYNDISISTTKNNSNISTNNIISDHHQLQNKKNNYRLSSYNKRFIKEESTSLSHTYLYNSVNMNSHYKNKSQIDFFKKNSQKKLPFIYKHLKKSISMDNLHNKVNNFGLIQNLDKVYNPITLYGRYAPNRYIGISQYKNQNSYINHNN